MVMAYVNANVNDEILKQFRDVIYRKSGLKKGDLMRSLEEAMHEYIQKYSQSNPKYFVLPVKVLA